MISNIHEFEDFQHAPSELFFLLDVFWARDSSFSEDQKVENYEKQSNKDTNWRQRFALLPVKRLTS